MCRLVGEDSCYGEVDRVIELCLRQRIVFDEDWSLCFVSIECRPGFALSCDCLYHEVTLHVSTKIMLMPQVSAETSEDAPRLHHG